jgi:phospholipid/cholesterol/gamma-HCH transport system substrate-binding protein
MATSIKHQALFTEAGGMVPGNDVTVSGVKVGTVRMWRCATATRW